MLWSFIMILLFLFSFSSHPMMKVILISIISTSSGLFTSSFLNFSFMGYLFILLMVSGSSVIFLYIGSLTPNFYTKYSPPLKYTKWILLFIFIPLTINSNLVSISPLSSISLPSLLLFLGIYLLLTLIICVSITDVSKGPLRST